METLDKTKSLFYFTIPGFTYVNSLKKGVAIMPIFQTWVSIAQFGRPLRQKEKRNEF